MKKIISLAICLALLGLAGCGERAPFTAGSYTPDAAVRGVALNVRDREITVLPSEDGQVHIAYSESAQEYYDISVSEAQVLTMTGADSREWTDYIGTKPPLADRQITLQLPDGLLETLSLSTTNEDITLSPLSVTGEIRISVNGGDIAFEALDAGSALSLAAKNGDISGAVAGRYEDFSIRSEVKKGESNLPAETAGSPKSLQVSCNHGEVSIDFQPPAP